MVRGLLCLLNKAMEKNHFGFGNVEDHASDPRKGAGYINSIVLSYVILVKRIRPL